MLANVSKIYCLSICWSKANICIESFKQLTRANKTANINSKHHQSKQNSKHMQTFVQIYANIPVRCCGHDRPPPRHAMPFMPTCYIYIGMESRGSAVARGARSRDETRGHPCGGHAVPTLCSRSLSCYHRRLTLRYAHWLSLHPCMVKMDRAVHHMRRIQHVASSRSTVPPPSLDSGTTVNWHDIDIGHMRW